MRHIRRQVAEGARARLLIVDDEPALRRLLVRVFEREHYQVLDAASGELAEITWRECDGDVDVLVTDIVLPGGMDGLELAHRLRLDRPQLPVLFTSGYCEGLMGARLSARAQDRLLPKPFHPREALRKVQSLLKQSLHNALAS